MSLSRQKLLGMAARMIAISLTMTARGDAVAEAEQPGAEASPPILLKVLVEGKFGFIGTDGEVVVEPQFVAVHDASAEARWGAQSKERWGFVDMHGKMVIAASYDEARPFAEGLAAVKTKAGWGYLDPAGETAIPAAYLRATDFQEGVARVALGGETEASGATTEKWGLINRQGKYLREPELAFIGEFQADLAPINRGGKWGFGQLFGGEWGSLDRQGKIAIEPQFERIEPLAEGLAAVRVKNQWGYVDRQGKMAIAPGFTRAGEFHDGVAIVRTQEGGSGVINRQGDIVIKCEYDGISRFQDGMATVIRKMKYGLVSISGQTLIPPECADIKLIGEGLAAVWRQAEDKWEIVNNQGKQVTLPKYTGIAPFSEGLAAVYVGGAYDPIAKRYAGGGWGYIDPADQIVIEPAFRDAWPFRDGLAFARPNEQWQIRLIRPNGEVVANHVPQGTFITPHIIMAVNRSQIGYFDWTKNHWLWKMQQ